MSATTTLREPRRASGIPVGVHASAKRGTLPERMRAALHGLCGRFGAIRLPAYVSAFETEHLVTLAEWSDCRTGMARQPMNETRDGGK